MDTRKQMIKKMIEYVLLGVIIFVLLLSAIYALFIKKDDDEKEILPYQEITYTVKRFTKLEKVIVTDENKVIRVNKKKIFIKAIDNNLYIDDKLLNDIILPKDDNDEYYLYYNDYLIFIYQKGINYDGLSKVINEDGEEVLINGILPFTVLEFNDNVLYGKSYIIEDGYAINNYYIFKYDGNKLSFNEVYPEITKVDKVVLGNKNRIIEINNKKVNLKVIENELYFNNQKIDNVFVENVYLTDYLILISNVGECDEVINAAIDEDGNLVKINNNNYQIHNIRIDNNILIANSTVCICEEDMCDKDSIVEIKYNGEHVIIE